VLTGGTIVNADSMQVYSVLDTITARPAKADQEVAPHLLYGHVHPSHSYSTGEWLRDVAGLLGSARQPARPLIFVGGTGLYFEALLNGLSAMPLVPASVRGKWRGKLAEEGAPVLHRLLARDDPQAAARLQPNDGQRVVRALEVLEASGRSILEWQRAKGTPLVDHNRAIRIKIEPDRAMLGRRIEERFRAMIGAGALEEARAMAQLGLDPAMPAMKAIGLRELIAVAEGRSTLDEAVESAVSATRQYAKRQATWMRNRFGPEWLALTEEPDLLRASDLARILTWG